MRAGDIIREERTKRGLSQYDLSDKTGIKQETISYIETGKRNATDQQKIALASYFNLPIEYIFFNQNNNK